MAWIESHQTLARHPKTMRVARALGISRVQVIGHLHFLWWWALEYYDDGVLATVSMQEIADAAEWEGDPALFLGALVAAGFLEEDDDAWLIHDWYEYAGKLVERREANAQRMREARAAKEKPRAKHVQRTSRARAGATVPNQTVPNTTVPNQTVPNTTVPVTPNGVAPSAPAPTEHRAIVLVLAETEGYEPGEKFAGSEWARLGGVASSLLKIGATADEVRVRAERYRRAHPDWEYTANALENRWGALAKETPAVSGRASPNGRTAPVTFTQQTVANNEAASEEFLAIAEGMTRGSSAVQRPNGSPRRGLPG